MAATGLGGVIEDRRVNAALGWLLVALVTVSAVTAFLRGDLIWAGFTFAVVVLAVVPAAAYRRLQAMLPWEVLFLASLPVVGRTVVAGLTVDGITLSGRITTYVAVAAVALIVAVELDVFSPVRMNYSFAVLFVVVTTMAAAGVWAIVKWLSDVYLGTAFMLDGRPERVVEAALMWDFVAATLAGVGAGVVFELYFRRRAHGTDRLPEDVREA
ncbi:MAG: hypothetical protein ABEJ28_03990 [Salinigranum sp.]